VKSFVRRDLPRLGVGFGGVAAVTMVYSRWLDVTNGTIVALTFLLIVLTLQKGRAGALQLLPQRQSVDAARARVAGRGR